MQEGRKIVMERVSVASFLAATPAMALSRSSGVPVEEMAFEEKTQMNWKRAS